VVVLLILSASTMALPPVSPVILLFRSSVVVVLLILSASAMALPPISPALLKLRTSVVMAWLCFTISAKLFALPSPMPLWPSQSLVTVVFPSKAHATAPAAVSTSALHRNASNRKPCRSTSVNPDSFPATLSTITFASLCIVAIAAAAARAASVFRASDV
jgi:hypothetical protein